MCRLPATLQESLEAPTIVDGEDGKDMTQLDAPSLVQGPCI